MPLFSLLQTSDCILQNRFTWRLSEKQCNYCSCCLSILKGFTVSAEHIQNGLLQVVKNTSLKGRWQILQEEPLAICDTAHNKEGLALVLNQLKKQNYQKLHIVLGVVADKILEDILPLFPKEATTIFASQQFQEGCLRRF